MNARTTRMMIGSLGLALGLAGAANAQCFADKLVDDNPGILNFMGSVVDIYSTNRVIVGAPASGSGGRVYFFERGGPQQWNEVDEIVSPDAAQGQQEYFGRAVAIYGNFAVVGAPMWDDGFDMDSGKVHIFRRTTIGGVPIWVLDESIENPSPDDNDQFGAAVDITIIGTTVTVAVGCPSDDLTGSAQAGRVRIYTRNADTGAWTQQDTLVANTAQADAHFGASLAFDSVGGDRILVGAPDEDVGAVDAGAAYLFTLSGSDWGAGTRFTSPMAYRNAGDQYGFDVALSDLWIAVGTPGEDENLETNCGGIFLYRDNSGVWTYMQRVLDIAPDAFDAIGNQIDLAAGVMVAGDPSDNFCHIWRVDDSGTWNADFPFVATDPPASGSHSFGSDCSLTPNGEYVLVGDAADDIGKSAGGAGSAYIFTTDQNPGSSCNGGLFDGVPVVADGETWLGCNGGTTDGVACVASNGDAWYQFTPDCSGILALSTCGTDDLAGQDEGIDTVLSVHTGCPGGLANMVACNDDAPDGNYVDACGALGDTGALRDSALKVSVTEGVTYRIRVASFGGGGANGLFFLHVDFSCCRVDWDGNGVVNSTDVGAFINDWFEDQAFGTLVTDFDGNGISNSVDVGEFINAWFIGCEI